MSKHPLNSVSDTIFLDSLQLVSPQVKKFKSEHPDETVIMAAATKARKMNSEHGISVGIGWAFARRGALILTEEAFYCGNWVIPISKLKYAEIATIPSILGYKGLLMKLADNNGNHFQFSLNNADLWLSQDIVSFKRTEPSKYYSLYIWGVRLALMVFFIYSLSQFVN
jgi:hypothetical protein